MFKLTLTLITMILLNVCTPGIGMGIPIGKLGYIGVGVNKNGVHPSAGVRVAPRVGVGVGL